ncbi:MAG: HlyC/CorC family transporter [Methanocalculus sp. MSAO_Arc1]|uniref:hemolysin family protein n=1 Tax=Methanocalculus TaxID=71151 RepID=UPI000FF4F219|nr:MULTISPECIES: hemolysin family protein [unclassified Methanocalculus]MCP1662066.1 CBS domain containing-hemolysin-like protein [Methanocalculus sp. AMF5]RQD80129.1 MAG: HlyC/CorC family transporter [Methanocalculus sp. MSAO_Arc1]
MASDPLHFILFFVCLFLSGFFSGSEVALIAITRAKVRTLVAEGTRSAHALAELKENTDHLLITILVGNNIVNVSAAAIATAIAIDYFGDAGVGIATGIVVILMLIIGEIGPKTYASKHIDAFALFVSRPILLLKKLFSPLLWLYDRIKKVRTTEDEPIHVGVTEEEIKEWIDVGEESGAIEENEREMLHSVFRFGDTTAREIMTPRPDVTMIEGTWRLEDALEIFHETGFSRLPVYHNDPDNIIGLLNVKDVFRAVHNTNSDIPIQDIIHDVSFVPESKKIDDLLKELQYKQTHLAIILDEYGVFSGVVSIEDILEELVGDILDEFDIEEEEVQNLRDGVYIIDAQAWVDDVNEVLEAPLPQDPDNYETVGGLVFARLGRIPHIGESITIPEINGRLTVTQMRGRQILKVKLTLERPLTD